MHSTGLALFSSRHARNLWLAALAAVMVPAVCAQTAHPNGNLQAIDSSIVRPAGVAVDTAGNVYVTSFGSGTQNSSAASGGVYKLALQADGSYVKSQINDPTKPLTTPSGIAVDAAGNVYVAQGSCFSGASSCNQQTTSWPSNVLIFSPSGSAYTQSSLTQDPRTSYNDGANGWPLVIAPAGLTVDAAGQNIFVSVFKAGPGTGPNSATVIHLCKNAGAWSTANCAQGFPWMALNAGVAMDGSGTVYYPDAGLSGLPPSKSKLYKAIAGASAYTSTTIATLSASFLVDPLTGVAVDSAGQNLYYTLPSKRLLGYMSPPTAAPANTIPGVTTLLSPANFPDTNLSATQMSTGFPMGIAVDSAAALYLTNGNKPTAGSSPQAGADVVAKLTPMVWDYGTINPLQSSASHTFMFTVDSASASAAVNIGTSNPNFVVDTSGPNTCSNATAAGPCSVTVKFSPTAGGPQQGYVQLKNAQGVVIAQILVKGTGFSAPSSATAVPVPGLRPWAQLLLSLMLVMAAVLGLSRRV